MLETEDDQTKAPTGGRTGPRKSLWALRIAAVIASVAVLAQPILAGYYLDGDVDAVAMHGLNGHTVLVLIFAQAIAALVYMTAGKGKGWPLLANIALWFGSGMQIGMGYSSNLAVHVPLGVAIVAVQLGLTVWLFTAAAGRARKVRQ